MGLIRRNELLKIQVQLDDSLQKMKTAEANLQKSLHFLAYETDSEIAGNRIDFADLNKLPETRDLAYYQSLLAASQSEIKALQSLQGSKSNQARAFRAAYYPSVDVAAQYRRYGDDFVFGMEEGREDEVRLKLDVSLNLFNGFRKQARIEEKQIESDLHELKKNLNTQLKNAFLDLTVARDNLVVAETGVAQASENLRITDAAFQEGVETATDVLDAVMNLSWAKFNAIHSRSDVFSKYYQLMRIVETL